MIATASHKGKGDGTPTPKMERTQRISEGTRQWFRFVHIGFFHVLIGANILLTRPDWFCLLDCHDKHRVLMGEPTICTSLLWVLEILNRHYCLLQRGR